VDAFEPGVSLLVFLTKLVIQKSLEQARRDWVTTEGSGRRVEVVMTFKAPPAELPDWVLVAIEGPDRQRTAIHADLRGELSLRVVAGPQRIAAMFLKKSMFTQVQPTLVAYHESNPLWVKPRQEFAVVGGPITAEVARTFAEIPLEQREFRIAGQRAEDSTGRPAPEDLMARWDDRIRDAVSNGMCWAHTWSGICGKKSPGRNRICERHAGRVLAGEHVFWDEDGSAGRQILRSEIQR